MIINIFQHRAVNGLFLKGCNRVFCVCINSYNISLGIVGFFFFLSLDELTLFLKMFFGRASYSHRQLLKRLHFFFLSSRAVEERELSCNGIVNVMFKIGLSFGKK